jgi:enoyl-CoA hydratase
MSTHREPAVLLSLDGHVATLTLNQPDKLNPMSPELIETLPGLIAQLRGDEQVRAVVLTGAGRAFSAGADFRTLAGLIEQNGLDGIAGVHAGIRQIYAAFLPIAQIEVPVIAAINGHAVGGGLGIALLADIRIASDEAKMGANFSRLGLHPGLGISQRLIRAVGHQMASELLFTGRLIRGDEAVRIGLCHSALPAEQVLPAALALAQQIAQAAPLAVRSIKHTLRTAGEEDIDSVLDKEAMAQAILSQTADAAEGIAAQMGRRTPEFKGR